jgi:hypothetical protein
LFLCSSHHFLLPWPVCFPALAIFIVSHYKKHETAISTCRKTMAFRTAEFGTGRMHLTIRRSSSLHV